MEQRCWGVQTRRGVGDAVPVHTDGGPQLFLQLKVPARLPCFHGRVTDADLRAQTPRVFASTASLCTATRS
jgi:hypothetical protein